MIQRIALFGGSFNPPGKHHRLLAELLAKQFDKVIIIPCGPRPDKSSVQDVDSVYRAALVDMTFRKVSHVEIDLFDLEYSVFTRTHELQEKYKSRGELWHVVGADLIAGGGDGASSVHRVWQEGEKMWNELNFVVVTRPGYQFDEKDLPPNHIIVEFDNENSSTKIRDNIYKRIPVTGLVDATCEAYIERYGLYRGRIPNRLTRWQFKEPRLFIFADERNARAAAWKEQFRQYAVEEEDDPNCILVMGGDGTMLRAVRKYWNWQIPFLGLNAGHLGFLLNNSESILKNPFPPEAFLLRQLPMLFVEAVDENGGYSKDYAFNDAWVERATPQSAWLELSINGKTRISKMVCDGALLATPSGSTAYARSMGAAPLLADTLGWIIAGSNVMTPGGWKSALLSPDSVIELRNLDKNKRPIQGFVDGRPLSKLELFRVRLSRTATVELAFLPNHDISEKIADVQFPTLTGGI